MIAEALAESVSEALGWDKDTIQLEKEFTGKELEYVETQHPFIDRVSLVINGGHVTTDAGTGCVHTAPGHGEDDYVVGQKTIYLSLVLLMIKVSSQKKADNLKVCSMIKQIKL